MRARRRLALIILFVAPCIGRAQSASDTAAAQAIALTPASTSIAMNPAMLGDRVRAQLNYGYAHKPFWRTSGFALNVGNFRIQGGRGTFAFPPWEDEYYVGADYARTLVDVRVAPYVNLVIGADASVGYGAQKFSEGFGYVAETTGGFLSAALRTEAGPITIIPYFAPGFFTGRYTRVDQGIFFRQTGKRFTEGGGLRLELLDHFNVEFGVRKTIIGDAVPRYGMSVGVAALPVPRGVASNVSNLRIEMDNDYFAFNTPRLQRPDQDYTNGLRVSFDQSRPLGMFAFLTGHLAPCSAEPRISRCALSRVELGQEIYTPLDDGSLNLEYDRRYAGWLYGSYSGHTLTDREDRSISLTAGVVGPQSLAKTVQTGFHALFPLYYHRNGWDKQLAFEPGFVVSAADRYLLGGESAFANYFQIIPEWRLSVGNVLTGASAKAAARVGYNLAGSWAGHRMPRPMFAAFAFAAEREDLVLHNIFLDGNTFRHNSPVKRVPWVWQHETGVGLTFGVVTAEYRLAKREREYRVQSFATSTPVTVSASTGGVPVLNIPGSHPVGTLSLTIDRSF